MARTVAYPIFTADLSFSHINNNAMYIHANTNKDTRIESNYVKEDTEGTAFIALRVVNGEDGFYANTLLSIGQARTIQAQMQDALEKHSSAFKDELLCADCGKECDAKRVRDSFSHEHGKQDMYFTRSSCCDQDVLNGIGEVYHLPIEPDEPRYPEDDE